MLVRSVDNRVRRGRLYSSTLKKEEGDGEGVGEGEGEEEEGEHMEQAHVG